jgi:hypothetical protein
MQYAFSYRKDNTNKHYGKCYLQHKLVNYVGQEQVQAMPLKLTKENV